MALIQFGKKEIEALEKANQKLTQELGKERALSRKLNALLISKEKEISELKQQLRDIEKIKNNNHKLKEMIKASSKIQKQH